MADVIEATRFYIDKIVSDPKIGGMKVLLLDELTTQVVSTVYSQTHVLEKEVYLVDRLDGGGKGGVKKDERLPHLKAAVFCRPTRENLDLLRQELARPRYLEYHLFFSNVVPQDLLQQLAEADEHEVVRQVQEYYADFVAVNEDLVTLNQRHALTLLQETASVSGETQLSQNVAAVLSLLLALKKKPSQIRFPARSGACRQAAAEVAAALAADGIHDFRRQEGPLLLLLDRRDDPVTPLLAQWTYQAMVHELLGLHNHRAVLRGAPGVRHRDLEEVVLAPAQDEFFARHRTSNFGDVGMAVKGLVDQFQQESKVNENIQSVEDMQAFLERYPAFRARSNQVSKHVAVLGELGRRVEAGGLMALSALEQDLACRDDHAAQYRQLMDKLQDARVAPADKLRLAALYALRHEAQGNLHSVRQRLADPDTGVGPQKAALIDALLRYAGEARRAPGLYGAGGLMGKLATAARTGLLSDAQNVYTQHVPLLMATLDSALKGRLKESQFPAAGAALNTKPPDVIVFMLGGTTYEEACKVAELNAQLAKAPQPQRVILGGSCLHNSASFLEDLAAHARAEAHFSSDYV
mmetsp:Transcript_8333/g.13509  ORF Transcript_8333/g.13509 Transcript_8333/m.13509 type:complete len:580 (-) Transcript_8333:67-1806(-)